MAKMLKSKVVDTRFENEKSLKGAATFLLVIGTISSIAVGWYLYVAIGWVGIVAALLNEAIVYAFSYFITVVAEISITLKNRPDNKD